jgi:mono/diheme cytochrome c family protein
MNYVRSSAVAIALSAASAFAFSFVASGPTFAEPEEVLITTRGAAILDEKCSRCHATGKSDTSRHPDAPPFRVIVTRYPVETLAEALGEGIITGHPDMPLFVFEPEEIDGILAYLSTLLPEKKD